MEVEKTLHNLGTFGIWQIQLFCTVMLFIKTFCSTRVYAVIYTGYKPPHHCKLPENSSLHQWIPLIDNDTFSSCSMYDIDSSTNNSVFILSNQTTNCNNGWTFDLEESGPTIVSKWDLVCDRTYLIQTSQMVLVIGQASSLFAAKFSDKFGRKPAMITCVFLMSLFGLLSAVVNKIEIFFFLKFFTGLFVGASTVSQVVYLAESFSSSGRSFYLVLSGGYWGLSGAFLSILAYFMRNWIYLECCLSICSFMCIPFIIWWLPETLPWLYANGRLQKAEAVVKRIAKQNKIDLIKQDLEIFSNKKKSVDLDSKPSIVSEIETSGLTEERSVTDNVNYSITILVRNSYLRRHMSLALILFIDNFCFYGVTYISGSVSTNRFISAFFNCFVELPASLVAYLICRKYGKKFSVILFHFLAAVPIFLCTLTTAYEEKVTVLEKLTFALNIFFKFCTAASYSVMCIIGAELFPTNIRAQAVSICAMVGKCGGILAVYTSLIFELYPKSLFTFLGVMIFFGGVLTFLLPETKNKPIPNTVAEINAWYDEKTPET